MNMQIGIQQTNSDTYIQIAIRSLFSTERSSFGVLHFEKRNIRDVV